ncbi:hypothetical protein [Thermomonospora umbrina]|uniref:Carboxypeptidase family protein n=1 Tax=Thermomonospora umbrina TaxID=111806 RepID=A0A3D9SMN6_9ACTN|nr:hypothetical protein [Thermomonospora umbrina]REE96997.1 hypothetical protein DFJ69_2451 [Thermomonospora umbrina]
MRRLLSAVLGLVALATFLIAPPRTAGADTGIAIDHGFINTPDAEGRTTVGTSAESADGITDVIVRLRLRGSTEPYAVIRDFERLRGTDQRGSWRSRESVVLQRGITFMDVEVVDGAGDRVVREMVDVETFPTPPNPVGGVKITDDDGRIGGVVHGRFRLAYTESANWGVARVAAMMRPAGRPEVVATVADFAVTHRADALVTWSSPTYVNLPAGDYEIDVSVWNAEGVELFHHSMRRVTTRLKTAFEGVTASLGTTDAESGNVTVRGRLVYFDLNGARLPLGGKEVTVANSASVVTDPDGRFTTTVSVAPPSSGVFTTFDADDTYGNAYAHARLDVRRLTTRLTLTAPGNKFVGDAVTFSGRLERQDAAGKWGGLGGRPIVLESFAGGNLWAGPVSVRTGPDGNFSVVVRSVRANRYRASYRPPLGDEGYRPAVGHLSYKARQRTEISGFTVAPNPVGVGGRVAVKGRVMHVGGARESVPGAQINVQFSTDGKRWSTVLTGAADHWGRFWFEPTAKRDGYWRAVYQAGVHRDHPLAVMQSSISPARYVDVRFSAKFSRFDATPEPVRRGRPLTVNGTLRLHKSGRWLNGAHAKVSIHFLAPGSSTWRRMASLTTDRYGTFKKTFKAGQDGTWVARYAGTATYIPVQSTRDHVDVR